MPYLTVEDHVYECDAIIFDKDGTLLHFIELWGSWAEDLLARTGQKLKSLGSDWTGDVDQVLGITRSAQGKLIDYDRSGPLAMATADELVGVLAWQLYVAGLPWHQSVTCIREFAELAQRQIHQNQSVQPLPGLRPLLEEARNAGIKLAVATSDTTSAATQHLKWAGLDRFFQCIKGRDAVAEGKPAPDLVLETCHQLNVVPERTIVIGDSEADMMMAQRAGVLIAIGVAPDRSVPSYLNTADYVINHYEALGITT
ncbi:HAD family hydrolase [Saccharibacillus sp. JS10]|uniref:HAD family hydrolase n=1 Tax=Saccharibacillus sp. JS10 TaxID=2950552 RepID=UPI00210CA417|nr:HAD family hydrolase [Saccharibacillus sp. JS10]MCQ4086254.1 HAD family hydrolase [Saccharibacillus sp. JS10]